jgi:hypothetical protein
VALVGVPHSRCDHCHRPAGHGSGRPEEALAKKNGEARSTIALIIAICGTLAGFTLSTLIAFL